MTDEKLMGTLMRTAACARRNPHRDQGNEKHRPPFGRGYGHILGLLSRQDGVSQQQLADEIGIRPQSVSEAVSVMEGHGFVRREPSEADRRVMLIYITEEGRSQHQRISVERQLHAREFFTVLNEEEKQTLFGLLEKLRQANGQTKLPEKEGP